MSQRRPPASVSARRFPKTKACILSIEDSSAMSRLIRSALRKENYQVVSTRNGRSGLKVASVIRPDLVILDLDLPGKDGLDVLKVLRARGRVPVVILTGSRKGVDCIVGLKLGADDYLVKPISMAELSARVEAVLRRSAPAPVKAGGRQTRGHLRLDSNTHEVLVADKPLLLDPKEFHILRLLLEARGRVVGRKELLLTVWGYTDDLAMDPRMVDQYVSRIRRKLGREGRRIVTVPTIGYKVRL